MSNTNYSTAMTYFLCAENIFYIMLIENTPSDILLDCHMALYSVSQKGIRICTINVRAWGSVVVKALRYYSDNPWIDSR